jgi:MFS family permease
MISFLASAILIGVDVYLPVYIQNILGFNATVSGLALAPMSVFWLLASVILGKRIVKYGGKAIILLSSAVLLASTVLLHALGINSSLLLVLIFASIMGFGFGGAFTTLTIVIQESVEYSQRGAATAANSLLRSLGQTIGVSAFGSIFNLSIVKYFMKIGISGVDPSNLYKSSSHTAAVTGEQIRLALNSSLHVLFIILIVISGLSLLLSMVMPKILFKDEA